MKYLYAIWLLLAISVHFTIERFNWAFWCLFSIWIILSFLVARKLDKDEMTTSEKKQQ